MGVRLQLLLGILLFGSICGSEGNTTISKDASLEKVDSTRNVIEKLPKTDTQINLVDKDTHNNSEDSFKYSKYASDSDTNKNDTSNQNYLNTNESSGNENDGKGRRDNSRSIDLDKFDSHDFQNNDYGSSDNQKFLENSIRKSSTKTYSDFTRFHLTSPKSIFDSKFEEAKQKIEQEYEEHTPEHIYDHNVDDEMDEDDHKLQFHRLFSETKNKPNSTLDYKEKTKISKNNTILDDSEYNELTVEKTHNINFDVVFNFTTEEEDTETPATTTPSKIKQEITSPRSFTTTTTKKTITLTKPPMNQNNHILSNKIESETIKAINLLTTEYSTAKGLKEDNELVSKEQTVEENKIVPLETIVFTTTTQQKNDSPTTEVPTTAYYVLHSQNDTTTADYVLHSQNDTTTEQIEHTTIPSDLKTTEIDSTTISVTETTEVTTEQATTTQESIQTTTTYEDSPTVTQAYDLKIETTDVPTTESTTMLTTTTETEKSTIEQFTENLNRISKAYTFESTLAPETTEATTETIRIKLSTLIDNNFTTDMTVIKTGIVTDAATTTIKGNEIETTSLGIDLRVFESTTLVPNTTTESQTTEASTTTVGTPDKINLTTVGVTTVRLPETTEETKLNYPTITTVIPIFRNISVATEETKDLVTTTGNTEDFSESTPGADTGNLEGGEENKGKIAAIVISTLGAVCLILLAGLLYIMRKRQKRFNYKQRCRPVGLDDYSVDNVSGYNSTRRKAERQSKRSYGNPAFDDPAVVTHPLNFTALAKFATNSDDVKAEFEEIPQITTKTYELPEGCETKNRYANVIPLPETRVYLQPIDGYANSDYINANYVTGPKNTKNYYIACQAPMQNTVDDFWRMVWEQQTKVILMLTHLFENGMEKCVDYLPPSEVLDCNRLFGDFQITLRKRDVKEKYIISNLQLKNMVSNSWREITHFWYLGWPEKGVPSEENSIIAFLIEARSYMKTSTLDKNASLNGNMNGHSKNEINPVVVHCSPGTGRTGVVIACDIAIREFEQTRLVDIPKIVYRIRRDRASAVQTKEQYMFIYKVVSLYATKLTGGALESF